MGTSLKILCGDSPRGETQRRFPDTKKLRELGFKHKFDLESGLSKILTKK